MKKCILAFILILILVFCSSAASFAATDQDVTIVNPVSGSSFTSSNLLISVKITQPKTIKVSAYELRKTVDETTTAPLGESDMKAIIEGTYTESDSLTYATVVEGESFTTTNRLSFYTKKLENINPGVYRIKVETIYKDKVVYSRISYVTIKSKDPQADSVLFDSSQSGTAVFLQNLLKSIFSNEK